MESVFWFILGAIFTCLILSIATYEAYKKERNQLKPGPHPEW